MSAAPPGLPVGFRLALDARTAMPDDRTVIGGDPLRVIRLSAAGRAAWDELRAGHVRTRSAARLARRLTDAGVAHPCPPLPSVAPDVTVVVPVRDRADALARCLAGLGRAWPVIVVDDGSIDTGAVHAVAELHGATVVRRDTNGGPAAAREDGLRRVRSEFVAFVDSDCVPGPDWIPFLAAHFADPLVGAVAPRVVPSAHLTATDRYAARFGALGQGGRAAMVRPGSRVGYVPTAALVALRAVLLSVSVHGRVFDPALRYGEDVDLVWRLHAAGWRVRYDPTIDVAHSEPGSWPHVFGRRFRYGTSAAPLSMRHPGTPPPLVLSPLHAAALAAVVLRRPATAAVVAGAAAVQVSRRAGMSAPDAARMTVGATVATWRGAGRYLMQFFLPAVAAFALWPGRRRRARMVAAALLAAGGIDDIRFAPARLADHVAYGAGVWAGCATERTLRPVRPVLVGVARRR